VATVSAGEVVSSTSRTKVLGSAPAIESYDVFWSSMDHVARCTVYRLLREEDRDLRLGLRRPDEGHAGQLLVRDCRRICNSVGMVVCGLDDCRLCPFPARFAWHGNGEYVPDRGNVRIDGLQPKRYIYSGLGILTQEEIRSSVDLV